MSFAADRVELARGANSLLILPAARRNNLARDAEGRAAEAAGLMAAIGLNHLETIHFTLRAPHPATLLGVGQVATISEICVSEDIELVVVDAALTPVQQRNLERAFGTKVIDRTALILEIFGERAATAEGRMQVELAHLAYQQGRLVRSWTHLERQRGGFGFLGGPGETQIEADRRMIGDRMAAIRKRLDGVKRTRALHRARRQKAPWPVVALVGYTNAGKSTLFNMMSSSSVMAEDLLFATLDPTMRQIALPGIGKTILSDTVGFVSDLPTELVAAFRATLEEVASADLLLHIRDISHHETQAQRADVWKVLADLGVCDANGDTSAVPIIEVYNKMDLLPPDAHAEVIAAAARDGAIALSATTGEGVGQLQAAVAHLLGGDDVERSLVLDAGDGATRAWLHKNGAILSETYDDAGKTFLTVRLSARRHGQLAARLHQPSAVD